MTATFVGVRHHSPVCARLVASVIESLRPAFVLIEGPADFNDRLDELLLGHELPIAVFSSYRDGERSHTSWAPLCSYSPEWVALTAGRAHGAEVRFIDLPAWHSAFAGRDNRYADAEQRYADVVAHLCETFAVDQVDTLWDHLFELGPQEGLSERLAAYFALIREASQVSDQDAERERYMARWVRAAVTEAGNQPVVVVTGGFHQPALRALAAQETPDHDWPGVPRPADDAVGGSFLVPYSFRRLDAFTGYQSGMPSPGYYQRVWDEGPRAAAVGLVQDVVTRLRQRGQPVSTADLIAARTMSEGLARLRGNHHPARTDVLDGLVSALVTDDLGQRLPWASRAALSPDAHPVVVEMVAALSGDRTGRLHPDTPTPPLVHDVTARLERLKLDRDGSLTLDLADDRELDRSRVLHRLRMLDLPGFERVSGPLTGADLVRDEHWTLFHSPLVLPRLIEAGAHGATLEAAASAILRERVMAAGTDLAQLAEALFDAALCGLIELADSAAVAIENGVSAARNLATLGQVLTTVLGLWRHDRILGTARSRLFGVVINAAVTRVLWLAEGLHGGPAPADRGRLTALAATRDAVLHAAAVVDLPRSAVIATARRISGDPAAPPDLRGAAFGLCWALKAVSQHSSGCPTPGTAPRRVGETSTYLQYEDAPPPCDAPHHTPFTDPKGITGQPLGHGGDLAQAIAGTADAHLLGDWLSGLFALARAEVLAGGDTVIGVLDTMVAAMTDDDFLVALPALRQAFEYFPPREREMVARVTLERRGLRGSAKALTKTLADPLLVAQGMALEARVSRLLASEGLGPAKEAP